MKKNKIIKELVDKEEYVGNKYFVNEADYYNLWEKYLQLQRELSSIKCLINRTLYVDFPHQYIAKPLEELRNSPGYKEYRNLLRKRGEHL